MSTTVCRAGEKFVPIVRSAEDNQRLRILSDDFVQRRRNQESQDKLAASLFGTEVRVGYTSAESPSPHSNQNPVGE